MNKYIFFGVSISLSIITIPLLFTLGSFVTASTLELFQLSYLNPNNLLSSIAGVLLVLVVAKEILTNATFYFPLYRDIGYHIAAGVFHYPYALSKTRFTKSFQQALSRLKLFVYPKLKIALGGFLVLVIFTITFPPALALLLSLYVFSSFNDFLKERNSVPLSSVIRGFTWRSGAELAKKWSNKPTEKLIPWGALFIPKENEPLHIILVGTTGTGKSIFQKTIEKKVLPGNKGIVNDPKPDQTDGKVPELAGLGVNFIIANPFDKRNWAWHMPRDVKGEAMAYELALLILPEDKTGSDSRFFDEAGRIALVMVIVSLGNAQGENWTLRLVILCSQSPFFEALIKRYHPRPNEFDEFLKAKKKENERNDVLVTLQAKLLQYSTVAALWEHSEHKISLKDFVNDQLYKNTTLVMGSDAIHGELLALINHLEFGFLAKFLKALPTNRNRRILISLDEAASEKVTPWPELDSIMAIGRGGGICCCLSILSMAKFKQAFGELVAIGLFELARHKAIFGVGAETAEFLSKSLGVYEYVEQSYGSSVSSSPQGTTYSNTVNEKLSTRPVALASDFFDSNRPQTGPENGLLGDFMAPGEGIHRHHFTWDEIQKMQPTRSEEVLAYDRIDDADPRAVLRPLTKEELEPWLPEAFQKKAPNNQDPSSPSSKPKLRNPHNSTQKPEGE